MSTLGIADPPPVHPDAPEPLPAVLPGRPPLPAVPELDLVAAFLSGRKPTTVRAYARDLADFAGFVGAPSAGAAVEGLLALGAGNANACALAYRADLMARGLAPATVARRLAALRSMVKLARALGRVAWALEVEPPRVEPLRDVRGPGPGGFRAMLAAAAGGSPTAVRDRAILRCLHDLGLRRGELVALDRADLDADGRRLAVLGKGRTAKGWLTVPGPTLGAIAAWLAVRGDGPGPLFWRTDRGAGPGARGRLHGETVRRIVRRSGARAGLGRPTAPHQLRHLAITTALDRTGGDVRTVRAFSRHRKVEVVLLYDDRRRDDAGRVAELVAGG